MLRADALRVAAASAPRTNAEELISNGVLKLRHELRQWHSEFETLHPRVLFTRLDDMKLKTLGDEKAMAVRCKAAAARPLVQFSVHLLQKYADSVPPEMATLRPAGEALVRIIELLRTSPRVQPVGVTQGLHDNLKAYLTLSTRAGVEPTPKCHLAMHLVARTRRLESHCVSDHLFLKFRHEGGSRARGM